MAESYQQRQERLRSVAGSESVGLIDGLFKAKLGHYVVRVIAIANVVDLAIGTFSIRYYRFSEAYLGKTIVVWYLVSSFALPLYVLSEGWFLRKVSAERKPILLDALFAIGWFLILWSSAVYSLFHTVWL